MSKFEKSFYKLISYSRSKITLNIFNFITNIEDSIYILPYLYLGNINSSSDIEFLNSKNITSIVNCSCDIPFNDYFKDKNMFRLKINDDKETENIKKFEEDILKTIKFIDYEITNKRPVLVHCYFGLMRSATVIGCYLIIKYKMSVEDAIHLLKKKNAFTFNSHYNFIEVLNNVHEKFNT